MSLLAVTHLASASAWAVYAVGALMALAGAGGVVLQRNPVHCALALVTTIFGIALLFIDQGADFLAAVQVIVYAGAIVILFLFVIMLLGVDRKEQRAPEKLKGLIHRLQGRGRGPQRPGRKRPEARSEHFHRLPPTF